MQINWKGKVISAMLIAAATTIVQLSVLNFSVYNWLTVGFTVIYWCLGVFMLRQYRILQEDRKLFQEERERLLQEKRVRNDSDYIWEKLKQGFPYTTHPSKFPKALFETSAYAQHEFDHRIPSLKPPVCPKTDCHKAALINEKDGSFCSACGQQYSKQRIDNFQTMARDAVGKQIKAWLEDKERSDA